MSKDRNPKPEPEPPAPTQGIFLEALTDHPIGAAIYELLFDKPPLAHKPERRRK